MDVDTTTPTQPPPPPLNGDISTMDSTDICATPTPAPTPTNNNSEATYNLGGYTESRSNGFADVMDVVSDSNYPGVEAHSVEVSNGGVRAVQGISTTPEPEIERVPKIFICTEHCKPDTNEDDETTVPPVCAGSSTNEESYSSVENAGNSQAHHKRDGGQNESYDNTNPQYSQNVTNSENRNQDNLGRNPSMESNAKSEGFDDEMEKRGTDELMKKDEEDKSCSEKENEFQSGCPETSNNSEEPSPSHATSSQPTASPLSSSPSSSSPLSSSSCSSSTSSSSTQQSASSKFSFFRSIQNILIATKWSKLRTHGSPKSQKQQNTGSELDDDQQQQRLKKPETRQRKISSKSQPGELLRKQSHGDGKDISNQENVDAARSRDGNEQHLSSSPRNSKDKGSSLAKGHPFSLFKRHNNSSSDSQPQSPPSPPTPPPAELTERQKALLRSSWAEIGDSVGQVGVIAFIGLFETHPDVIDHFDQFRGMSLESVFTSISLREHALRVMTTVEKFLNRIDRPDKLQKILEDLGKRHVGYKFKYEYIKIVGMQFICAMRPHVNSWTSETEQAWTALVDTMTFHMQTGAFMELQQASSC